jgi:calcineurin-like phosphoesterase family protein
MYFFTADQHFGEQNIIDHCYRPWKTSDDMNAALIMAWNNRVSPQDVVVVAGDFAYGMWKANHVEPILKQLSGSKIFLLVNHDRWMKENKRYIYHKSIEKQQVAVCHYPMRSWKNSVHGSWNLHGHCHGNMEPLYNQLDVGVDNAFKLFGSYGPISFNEVKAIMEDQDNDFENIK